MPISVATTLSWATVSTSSAAATGTDSTTSPRATCAVTSDARSGNFDTMTPDGNPMISQAATPAAEMMLTSRVDASRVRTATSGRATVVTAVPNQLIVDDAYTR